MASDKLPSEYFHGDDWSVLLLVVITGAIAAKTMLNMSITTIISAKVNPFLIFNIKLLHKVNVFIYIISYVALIVKQKYKAKHYVNYQAFVK